MVKKWEYFIKTFDIDVTSTYTGPTKTYFKELEENLPVLGNAGWELIELKWGPITLFAIFKRPKVSRPKTKKSKTTLKKSKVY